MTKKPPQTPDDYGNQFVSSEQIARHIEIDPEARIIMGIGPCRSGSKAQLYLMGASGYSAFDQPVNAIYRSLRMSEPPEAVSFPEKTTYFKETWGPYTPGECRLEPVEIFQNVVSLEWIQNHFTVVFLPRNPADTWDSWQSQWSENLQEDTLFEHFCLSYQTMADCYEKYQTLGIPMEIFPYEANREPKKNYRQLFQRLNLKKNPVVDGWNQPEIREQINSHVREFYEPKIFLPPGIRDDVKQADGIFYSDDDSIQIEREIPEEIHQFYHDLLKKSFL